MNRYELIEGTSSKFWQYEVRGKRLVVEYGRIGVKAQSSTKTFESAEAAGRAAVKLVKEKTAKGYVAVQEGEARPEKTEPAQASSKLRTFQGEVDLTKVKIRSGEDDHGPGQWPRILWAVVDAGLLKKADAFVALKTLSASVELGSPSGILTALQSQPAKVPEADRFTLLDNYTLGMDALLVHLAHRAPELLQQHEKTLPANIRRAVPLVRVRLGHAATSDPAWMDELAKSYAHGYARGEPLVMLRDGKLVKEQIDTPASARDLAAFYGDAGVWQAKLRAAALAEDGTLAYSARTKPVFVRATIEELGKLLGPFFNDYHLQLILSERSDDIDDLSALLALDKEPGSSRNNQIATFIGTKAAARALTFEPPYGQAERYLAALRVLGQDAVLKKAKSFAASKDAEQRDRAAVALAAFYDDKLFRKLLAHDDVTDQDARCLALVGKPGLDALREALSSTEAGEYPHRFLAEAFTRAAAHALARDGFILDTRDDALVVSVSDEQDPTRALLASWPVARRHAWLKARSRDDESSVIALADLAPEALVDAAVAKILKMDGDSVLANREAFEAAGASVERSLLRLLPKHKSDKKLLRLLDWMQLSDAARAEAWRILGGGVDTFAAVANEERLLSVETTAALVVGKRVAGPLNVAKLRALCAHLDALALELRAHVAIAIGANVETTEAGSHVSAVLGIEVQRADTSAAREVDAAELERVVRTARTFPWERVAAMLPPGWSLDDEDPAAFCVAGGPLAVAKLAIGELVEDGAADDGKLIYGVAMGQEAKTTPVRGVLVASGSYDTDPVVRIDLPLGTKRGRAKHVSSFLIASYDY